jgi:hypothetical protein
MMLGRNDELTGLETRYKKFVVKKGYHYCTNLPYNKFVKFGND